MVYGQKWCTWEANAAARAFLWAREIGRRGFTPPRKLGKVHVSISVLGSVTVIHVRRSIKIYCAARQQLVQGPVAGEHRTSVYIHSE